MFSDRECNYLSTHTIEGSIEVYSFFDPHTCTGTHLVCAADTRECVIIDSVFGVDESTDLLDSHAPDILIRTVQKLGLKCVWLLETHTHADHVSAAPYLRSRLGGRIGIGQHVSFVRETYERTSLGEEVRGSRRIFFDQLLADGQQLSFGGGHFEVLAVPGHTPDACVYRFGRLLFIGDTLFHPDLGSARCDFVGGDAAALFRSSKRILSHSPSTILFLCHDYPTDRPVSLVTTVEEQRAKNIHLRDGVEELEFVAMRHLRDSKLSPPRLMGIAVGTNVYGGSDGLSDEDLPSILPATVSL